MSPAQAAIDALPGGDPLNTSQGLRDALSCGVAFHIADLTPEERAVVELHFRAPDATLCVIAATTTLAMGVNTPACAVVIVGLQHPPDKPYMVAECKNIVGRAGRLGHTERGTSYLIATSPHEAHQSILVPVRDQIPRRSPVALPFPRHRSPLAAPPGPGSHPIVLGGGHEHRGPRGIPGGEFRRLSADAGDRNRLLTALAELESHALVERTGRGGYHLAELGRIGGESRLLVESIIRLADALRPLSSDQANTATLITATQLTVELDQVLFPINKRSTLQEANNWTSELRRQNTAEAVLRMLHHAINEQHQAWARAKKAVACLV